MAYACSRKGKRMPKCCRGLILIFVCCWGATFVFPFAILFHQWKIASWLISLDHFGVLLVTFFPFCVPLSSDVQSWCLLTIQPQEGRAEANITFRVIIDWELDYDDTQISVGMKLDFWRLFIRYLFSRWSIGVKLDFWRYLNTRECFS